MYFRIFVVLLLLVPVAFGQYALQFDQANSDYVRVADNQTLDFTTNAWTIEGWFYFEETQARQGIISKRTEEQVEFTLWLGPSGPNKTILGDVGFSGGYAQFADLEPDIWYNFAFQYDGDGNTTLYVNGENVDETEVNEPQLLNADLNI